MMRMAILIFSCIRPSNCKGKNKQRKKGYSSLNCEQHLETFNLSSVSRQQKSEINADKPLRDMPYIPPCVFFLSNILRDQYNYNIHQVLRLISIAHADKDILKDWITFK